MRLDVVFFQIASLFLDEKQNPEELCSEIEGLLRVEAPQGYSVRKGKPHESDLRRRAAWRSRSKLDVDAPQLLLVQNDLGTLEVCSPTVRVSCTVHSLRCL